MTEQKIYPPLTAQEFAEGSGYTYRGVPIVENEWATCVFAFGHIDKRLYAGVVNDYDTEMGGPPEPPCTSRDVEHRWAVTVSPVDGPDGWFISWGDEHQDHPRRFPVTVVRR